MDNNKKLAIAIINVILGMICLAYASHPLYNLFCRVTGFGGTTQIARGTSDRIGTRQVLVQFDQNVMEDLPWEFSAKQKELKVKTGENNLVFYYAKNISDKDIIGTAVYNVTPHKAGIYFNKIQCFCFEEQLLKSGQEMILPVSFFIDPEFDSDPNMKDVNTITLSYSFFKAKKQTKD